MSQGSAATDAPTANATPRRPSGMLWNAILMGMGGMLLAGAGVWYLVTPAPETPGEKLTRALGLFDGGQPLAARALAEELAEVKYHDEDFAGGVEYILGMTLFQQAMKSGTRGTPATSDQLAEFAGALAYLKEAYELGLKPERVAAWNYAMGKSLYAMNERTKALPYLEQCVAPEHPDQLSAAQDLIEITLVPGWRTPERLAAALPLSERVGTALAAGSAEAFEAQLQRIDILLHMNRLEAATLALEELPVETDQRAAADVMKGRLLIAAGRYREAIEVLERVTSVGLEDATQSPRASFLMGYAAEQRSVQAQTELTETTRNLTATADSVDYRQRAIEYYRKTAARFERSDEARAALLHLGRLQQEDGAHEKAVQSFGTVLRSVPRDTDFANRWISLDDLRVRVLAAWNRWVETERFSEAIVLADLMSPTFPRDQAYELSARARQRWAELTEAKLTQVTPALRAELAVENRRLWRESAQGFAKLAEVRRDSVLYPDALWRATENSYRGHDFPTALVHLDEFLKEAAASMRPVALVLKGQILLDLDRVAEAEESFRLVRKEYPSSPAAFTAAYQIAVCRMEQQDVDGADAAWRAILSSNELTPPAKEWRESLFAVAKLQGDRAGYAWRKLESQTLNAEAIETLWEEVERRSRDATTLFEEYVARYPQSEQLTEVQYELGKALQLQGDLWRRTWDLAETDNARAQAQTEKARVLDRALGLFQTVRETLDPLGKQDRLEPLSQHLLENVWFEIPHTLFSLGRHDEAITEYGATIHRYPHDVRVLTAYVQMAEAYAQLNRPVEARSMLEQAKVILDQEQIPPTAFDAPTTSLTKVEWEQWLERARQVHRD